MIDYAYCQTNEAFDRHKQLANESPSPQCCNSYKADKKKIKVGLAYWFSEMSEEVTDPLGTYGYTDNTCM